MKRLFSKLALVFAITLMAGFVSSCSSNDDDDNVENTYTKEYTYSLTTDKITVDAGAPFTKDQIVKIYTDAINKASDGKLLDYDGMLNVARDVYKAQNMAVNYKYVHGSTIVMCHVKSTNKDMPVYSYDIDTDMITEFSTK